MQRCWLRLVTAHSLIRSSGVLIGADEDDLRCLGAANWGDCLRIRSKRLVRSDIALISEVSMGTLR